MWHLTYFLGLIFERNIKLGSREAYIRRISLYLRFYGMWILDLILHLSYWILKIMDIPILDLKVEKQIRASRIVMVAIVSTPIQYSSTLLANSPKPCQI